ncbi:hypothetical protein OUZ56_026099 [Daphnia magna]|uniref:Uncharacterized protein n=1 Tax=Daphnia magna TaxID=35525 RepID=A0ABQ9ZKS2_9CRUS|nr:hypothetical protein OUZ56_026099 [Daphnia magna]
MSEPEAWIGAAMGSGASKHYNGEHKEQHAAVPPIAKKGLSRYDMFCGFSFLQCGQAGSSQDGIRLDVQLACCVQLLSL